MRCCCSACCVWSVFSLLTFFVDVGRGVLPVLGHQSCKENGCRGVEAVRRTSSGEFAAVARPLQWPPGGCWTSRCRQADVSSDLYRQPCRGCSLAKSFSMVSFVVANGSAPFNCKRDAHQIRFQGTPSCVLHESGHSNHSSLNEHSRGAKNFGKNDNQKQSALGS